MTKDVCHSYKIMLEKSLALLIPHLHVTPIGMLNLAKIYKWPCPIFDSTFRIHPSSMAINDWVNPTNEPEIHFPKSFTHFCIWVYNLRILYPSQEIYLVDDVANDISGAFRHAKYSPPQLSCTPCMHFVWGIPVHVDWADLWRFSSPANFEPMAWAHKKDATCLWHQAGITLLCELHNACLHYSSKYLLPTPVFCSNPPPTLRIWEYLNCDDSCRSPMYEHHVYDNIYGDIEEFVSLGVVFSILVL